MKMLTLILASFGICSARIVRQTTSCGHAGYLTQDNGVIDSHTGFATNQDYPNDLDCKWTIQAPVGMAVQLTAKSLDLETHSPCTYDYLEVFDGDNLSGRSLGKFCGTTMGTVQSRQNFMSLHFVTDDDTQKKGFRLQYTFVNASTPSCGHAGYLTQDHGIVDSHSGFNTGAKYGDDLDCMWVIKAPAGMYVQLTAKSFDLEQHTGCDYDYLEVHDGDSTAGRSLGKFCGTSMTAVTSTQNSITLHFVTDTDTDGTGFRLQYSFTNISMQQLTSGCGHSGYLTAPNGIIDSHAGFATGVQYGNDLDCKWKIKAPVGMFVEITPKSFDLEDDDTCDYDYLELFDGDGLNAPSLGKFCGTTMLPIESTHNILTLQFVTDDDTRRAGFRFSYNFTVTYQTFCTSGEFKCKSNNCIDIGYRCDNDDDCGDDSDEMGCPRATCAGNKFLCNNTQCIDFNWLCDGDDDCGDNSDEDPQNCRASTTAASSSARCGSLTRSGPIGTVTSPGYPSQYGNDVSCVWKIVAPTGTTRISIKFEPTFDMESSSSCSYDSVSIYSDGRSLLHGPYCGSTAPTKFSIDGDHVFVEFKTDDSDGGNGFRLEWKALHI